MTSAAEGRGTGRAAARLELGPAPALGPRAAGAAGGLEPDGPAPAPDGPVQEAGIVCTSPMRKRGVAPRKRSEPRWPVRMRRTPLRRRGEKRECTLGSRATRVFAEHFTPRRSPPAYPLGARVSSYSSWTPPPQTLHHYLVLHPNRQAPRRHRQHSHRRRLHRGPIQTPMGHILGIHQAQSVLLRPRVDLCLSPAVGDGGHAAVHGIVLAQVHLVQIAPLFQSLRLPVRSASISCRLFLVAFVRDIRVIEPTDNRSLHKIKRIHA